MAKVPMELVKKLREMSGAGMMDCKNALEEADGDLEKAFTILREKGIAKASKRAGRSTGARLGQVRGRCPHRGQLVEQRPHCRGWTGARRPAELVYAAPAVAGVSRDGVVGQRRIAEGDHQAAAGGGALVPAQRAAAQSQVALVYEDGTATADGAVTSKRAVRYVELGREDDGSIGIGPADAGFGGPQPTLILSPSSDPRTGKLRLHIDVNATDRDQDAELERLLALGARPADVGQTGTESWHVLADPEGNEFCLLHTRLQPL